MLIIGRDETSGVSKRVVAPWCDGWDEGLGETVFAATTRRCQTSGYANSVCVDPGNEGTNWRDNNLMTMCAGVFSS